MRSVFTFSDLADSSYYFGPIFEAIFYANWKYYNTLPNDSRLHNGRNIRDYLSLGFEDLDYIYLQINDYNRCFIKLLKQAEIRTAFALVRLQLDNLTHIYAETLYPFDIFDKVFRKGKQLGKIKKSCENIIPRILREQIDEIFNTSVSKLYKDYNDFVHPSKAQVNLAMKYQIRNDEVVANKEQVKQYSRDMVMVNQTIGKVLLAHLDNINEKIKSQSSE